MTSATPAALKGVVAALRLLSTMPRPARRFVAILLDSILCLFAIWLALSLRLGEWDVRGRDVLTIYLVALSGWHVAAWQMEIYRSIIRSTGSRTMVDLAFSCLYMALPMSIVFLFAGINGIPRTIAFLQPLVFLVLLVISRLVIRYIVVDVLRSDQNRRQRVLIYGAGGAGQQLGQALRHEQQLSLAAFIDDDQRLVGQRIDGCRIYHSSDIGQVIYDLEVEEVLLAIPSASRMRKSEIVESLQGIGIHVRSLPSIGNIIGGKVSVSDLHEVQLEELLGRDTVPPDEELLGGTITNAVILVTGAGGSIGSELCRQIVARSPRCLIIVDHSEFALYQVDAELRAISSRCEIISELADIADNRTAMRLMKRWRPDTVFHAAAYKHVPLVETNPIAGLRNNVFGTLNCCLAAEQVGVERFVLVSTDKAVRPTNVMGASKRICELVLQARWAEGTTGTIFSMVRFGNVLGSSGSVVPRFREQIARGGPVTITHRDVTRYFMTIPEAAQLVLQAGAMASGGEVFVLDMNEPVQIIDLARTLIRLSGLTVSDESNPDGDIAIVEIGLRPGEKMYEELLIGENPQATCHPGIMRASERFILWAKLDQELAILSEALNDGRVDDAKTVMKRLVPEYRPTDISTDRRDHNARVLSDATTSVDCGETLQ